MKDQRPHEHRTCGAKTRNGTPCKRAPVPGRTRCRLHGGLSLAGVASPSFRTGRYSKHLPERLMERYVEACNDRELLALREEIALVDSRLNDMLARVDTGESGAAWQAVQAAWGRLQDAERNADAAARRQAVEELDALIRRGLLDTLAWREIREMLEQRRKLVESERRRLVDMQQMLTAEEATALVAAVTNAVRRHVTDRRTLALIAAEIAELSGRGGR